MAVTFFIDLAGASGPFEWAGTARRTASGSETSAFLASRVASTGAPFVEGAAWA